MFKKEEPSKKQNNNLKQKIKQFVKEGKTNSKSTNIDENISEEELEKIKKVAEEGGQYGLVGCTIC